MIAADANDVWIGVMGMVGVVLAALIAGYFSNRKTRAMNTAEHERSAAERRENREAVLMAIGMVHDEIGDVKADVKVIRTEQQVIKGDLRSHIEDRGAHASGELV